MCVTMTYTRAQIYNVRHKTGILGACCLVGALCCFILAMVVGSNALHLCGIVCGVIGFILGKMTDNIILVFLCAILAIADGLELFMRVRDGYNGKGWYYFHLLQHPEDNAWH